MLQKAFDAFEKKDYSMAGSLWLGYISLSSNTSDLKKIEVVCKKADQAGIQNEWIYATIAAVYLDGGDYFMDRESAVMEAITYAKKAIALQPLMYQAHRFAGSACYWLGDYSNAKKYYQQSINILPDLVLLQRIIECCKEINQPLPQVDLKIDFENTNPEYFYEQGVGANGLNVQNIPGISKDGALSLVRKSYERCYDLYSIQLIPPVVNNDGTISPDKHQHNLAMCCNNLSVIYNGLKMHNEALRVLNVGKQFSSFQALWENIRYTQCCLNNLDEETDAAIFLIENYDVSDELFYICMARICYYNMINKDYQDALDTANEAIEGYQNLSQQSQSNVTIVIVMQNYIPIKLLLKKLWVF